MKVCKIGLTATVFGSFASQILFAQSNHQPLLGARAAIKLINENDPEMKIEEAESLFAKDLKSYADSSAEMPPHEAAKQWLALLDEGLTIPHRSYNGGMGGFGGMGPPGSLDTMMEVLPRPKVWPELEAQVAQQPPSLYRTVLQMLLARLQGKDEDLLKYCKEYEGKPQTRNTASPWGTDTTAIRFAALRRLGKLSDPKIFEEAANESRAGSDMPNILDLLPRDQAEQVMLAILENLNGPLGFRNQANVRFAKEVALRHLSELPKAPWDLVDSWSDGQLVEKLVEHYGEASLAKSEPDYIRAQGEDSTAQELYFLGLAQQGKLDDAAKFLTDAQISPKLPLYGWTAQRPIDQFILDLQKHLPKADLWRAYVNAAIAAFHEKEARETLISHIGQAKTDAERLRLYAILFDLDTRVGTEKQLSEDDDQIQKLHFGPNDQDPTNLFFDIALATRNQELINKGIARQLKDSDDVSPGSAPYQALFLRGELNEVERLALRQLKFMAPILVGR